MQAGLGKRLGYPILEVRIGQASNPTNLNVSLPRLTRIMVAYGGIKHATNKHICEAITINDPR